MGTIQVFPFHFGYAKELKIGYKSEAQNSSTLNPLYYWPCFPLLVVID